MVTGSLSRRLRAAIYLDYGLPRTDPIDPTYGAAVREIAERRLARWRIYIVARVARDLTILAGWLALTLAMSRPLNSRVVIALIGAALLPAALASTRRRHLIAACRPARPGRLLSRFPSLDVVEVPEWSIIPAGGGLVFIVMLVVTRQWLPSLLMGSFVGVWFFALRKPMIKGLEERRLERSGGRIPDPSAGGDSPEEPTPD